MPCSDYSNYQYPPDHTRADWIQAKDRSDYLARLLCGVITRLRTDEQDKMLERLCKSVQGLAEFVAEHDNFDRLRAEAEAAIEKMHDIKRKALAKLSDEERQVLGL